jgi:hypothetical protein
MAFDQGQTVKTVHNWLQHDAGVVLSITTFTSYISRIRRKEAEKQRSTHSLIYQLSLLQQPRLATKHLLTSRRIPIR